MDLPDLAAARKKAIEGVRSMLSDEIKTGRIDLAGRIEITDESGNLLAEIPFEEAVRISMPRRPEPGQQPG
ncbi:hypothetical protein E2493_19505 [Sphingomonas parva]|uniref:DUF6894 domain-containing protein n=2 Tax=Sphingomonas parva TaxID=2555898 RepID=A0A4Y8ZMU9_9SPHN|nr:hypothetical protein E2493_19505 [Sphingomonas parva]